MSIILNKLYNENCLITMNNIPKEFIDLVITSPPYGKARDYHGFDFNFEETAYGLYKVIKAGGVLVWVCNDETINGSETGICFEQVLFFKKIGFNLHDTMIWDKGSCRYPDFTRYYSIFEYMFILSKGKPRVINLIRDKENITKGTKVSRKTGNRLKSGELVPKSCFFIDKNRVVKDVGIRNNIWKIPNCSTQKDKLALKHPAPFPDQLVKDHILTWTEKGQLVYDPFMGSGTVMKMAMLTERNFIGSEISEEYCQLAEKRLSLAKIRFATFF